MSGDNDLSVIGMVFGGIFTALGGAIAFGQSDEKAKLVERMAQNPKTIAEIKADAQKEDFSSFASPFAANDSKYVLVQGRVTCDPLTSRLGQAPCCFSRISTTATNGPVSERSSSEVFSPTSIQDATGSVRLLWDRSSQLPLVRGPNNRSFGQALLMSLMNVEEKEMILPRDVPIFAIGEVAALNDKDVCIRPPQTDRYRRTVMKPFIVSLQSPEEYVASERSNKRAANIFGGIMGAFGFGLGGYSAYHYFKSSR